MKKSLIIGLGIGVLVVLVICIVGFLGYKGYAKLAAYQEIGSASEINELKKNYEDLQKVYKDQITESEKLHKQFAVYRKQRLLTAETRAERKVETATASFIPLSGAYVLAAMSTQEQLENCLDVQQLLKFESDNFGISEPENFMLQEKICGTYIESEIAPLFKYQMLRVRASMNGSFGHLRPEAEQKFDDARKLLKRWEIAVDPELEKYIRF
ncbi:MAG: hypothetical protein ACRBB6_08870 [Neptuniibacter sp.]